MFNQVIVPRQRPVDRSNFTGTHVRIIVAVNCGVN